MEAVIKDPNGSDLREEVSDLREVTPVCGSHGGRSVRQLLPLRSQEAERDESRAGTQLTFSFCTAKEPSWGRPLVGWTIALPLT